MSAACVAAAATAGEKQTSAFTQHDVNAVASKVTDQPVNMARSAHVLKGHQSLSRRNVPMYAPGKGEMAMFRPESSVMAIGLSVNGYSYSKTFGFASSNAPIVFKNYSLGASSVDWKYTKLSDYTVEDNNAIWNYYNSNDFDLVVPTGRPGELMPPELNVKFESGNDDVYALDNVLEYMVGASAPMWGFVDSDNGPFGVSFYQDFGQENPDGQAFGYTDMTSYNVTDKRKFNEYGVYCNPADENGWMGVFKSELGTEVNNVSLENFMFFQQKPASAFLMSSGWVILQVNADKATQLMSYIYPVDEEGELAELPIAVGYASISKGKSPLVVFEYYPLDENGDELEGDIIIDSRVAISVEGFAGNPAIKEVRPGIGFDPFSYSKFTETQNRDFWLSPTLYMTFNMEADGQNVKMLACDTWPYQYSTKDEDLITFMFTQTFTLDALYPFMYAENGEESVTLPKDGGSAEVELTAYWYDFNQMLDTEGYVLTAPEWLDVSFSDPDPNTRITKMTVSAQAGEDRTGVVTIEGIGTSYSLTVNQGEGNAVSSIVVDKNAEYFDLQGRRVANPSKGLFIKKTGSKAEKVIL